MIGSVHRALAVPAALAALAAAGCGLGAGEQATGTRLLVSDDFGAHVLRDLAAPEAGGSDTAMRLLQRNASVTTRYGGGFVQSVDGRAGGTPGGRPVDWFYYVNGVLADEGAAAVRVRPDDAIWWDRHDWGAGETRAVVGTFPAPFRRGPDGRPLPVRIDCAAGAATACERVRTALAAAGIRAARVRLGAPAAAQSLRILVGPYAALRADATARALERGPRASGVYARFAADGASLTVLDRRGRPARRLGAASGLVAATFRAGARPLWTVTGTDAAGVAAAAAALDAKTLAHRFAVAVSGGRPLAVPAR